MHEGRHRPSPADSSLIKSEHTSGEHTIDALTNQDGTFITAESVHLLLNGAKANKDASTMIQDPQ